MRAGAETIPSERRANSRKNELPGTLHALPYHDEFGLPGGRLQPAPEQGGEPIEVTQLRGTNLAGMNMSYLDFDAGDGPIPDTHYPVYDERLVDYFASKNMTVMRFLFSWEAMQSTLFGPIPAFSVGNYGAYFDNYKRIVDYATSIKGMHIVIEPWQANPAGSVGGARWRGDVVGSAAVPRTAFADLWTRMATIFASNPLVSYGLVNEPNDMSTMSWWASAQAAVTAIRSTGSTQRIYVPGNGYTAASSWTDNFYDTATPQRSNAYGWLNANGVGVPIADPANNMMVEVHTYLDADEGGGTTGITSATAARDHLSVVVNEARARGYQVYLGEIGFYAGNPIAASAWTDFISYANANNDTLDAFTWWAGGAPGWWDDVAASGGGHFAITPTNGATFTGDTVNMNMIENDF
jgi:endoglucanase